MFAISLYKYWMSSLIAPAGTLGNGITGIYSFIHYLSLHLLYPLLIKFASFTNCLFWSWRQHNSLALDTCVNSVFATPVSHLRSKKLVLRGSDKMTHSEVRTSCDTTSIGRSPVFCCLLEVPHQECLLNVHLTKPHVKFGAIVTAILK